MPDEMPYMASVTNVDDIIQKIRGAGTPPRFTHEFLSSTLGFRSSNDRGFIKVLRALGMLTSDGTPTERYNAFKNQNNGGRAMADGLRDGWSQLYLADQAAHDKGTSELQEIFKTVTGKGDAVARKMATTFKAFAKHADFSSPASETPETASVEPTASAGPPDIEPPPHRMPADLSSLSLRHDVHLHLPPTSDVAVYAAIFRALREELLD